MGDRLAQWKTTVADAGGREPIDGGTRRSFGHDVDVAGIAALVAAEQDCCRFVAFTLAVGVDGVVRDIVFRNRCIG